jgi:hypothetical protein
MSALELLIYLLAAVAYFVPYYIAWYRNVNGKQLVFWLNLLFGWTLVAWVLLIVVSLSLKTDHHNQHTLIT